MTMFRMSASTKRRLYDRSLWWLARALPFEARPMPDFLIIGSSRSGTSWLHQVFRQHPDVFCPRIKEVHFFDRGTVRNRGVFRFDPENDAQWRWYALNFLPGKGRLIGDNTPAYSCLGEDVIRVIAARLPDIKLIYSFRNPIERAWSGVRKSFRDDDPEKMSYLTASEFVARATTHNQYTASAYADNVRRWESHFPTTQIHYSFHDDLAADPSEFLRSVCGFLGVSVEPVAHLAASQPVNTAPKKTIPGPVWDALVNKYRPHIEFLEQRFQRDLAHWMVPPEAR